MPAVTRVSGGPLHGIQPWVDLPCANRRNPPRHRSIEGPEAVSLSSPEGGALVRLIAGDIAGHREPGSTFTPVATVTGVVVAAGGFGLLVLHRFQRLVDGGGNAASPWGYRSPVRCKHPRGDWPGPAIGHATWLPQATVRGGAPGLREPRLAPHAEASR